MFHQRYDHGIFLYLYRRFFPDEYVASQESEEIDPGWSYSPREVDFLFLVDSHLFPLNLDFISEAGANGDRATETIYLMPCEMSWWYDDFEHLSPGWQVLRLLSGTVKSKEVRKMIGAMRGLPSAGRNELLHGSLAMAGAQPSQLKAVRTRFTHRGPPLSGFGQVLALYQCQTGNPWLDTDSGNEILYEGTCWCEKHVEEIAQTYQAARVYEQQVNAFANWLEEDSSRISQIIEVIEQEVPSQDQEAVKRGGRRHDGEK